MRRAPFARILDRAVDRRNASLRQVRIKTLRHPEGEHPDLGSIPQAPQLNPLIWLACTPGLSVRELCRQPSLAGHAHRPGKEGLEQPSG